MVVVKKTSKKKSRREFYQELAEARKNPNFVKEINAFIKASMTPYKLK